MNNWKQFLFYVLLVIGCYHLLYFLADIFLLEYINRYGLDVEFIRGILNGLSFYLPYLLVRRIFRNTDNTEKSENGDTDELTIADKPFQTTRNTFNEHLKQFFKDLLGGFLFLYFVFSIKYGTTVSIKIIFSEYWLIGMLIAGAIFLNIIKMIGRKMFRNKYSKHT